MGKAISPDSYTTSDDMLSSQARTNFTSRGWLALSPWNNPNYTYSVLQVNLGNNPNSKLEIVSALNSFNITREMYLYNHINRTEKYNAKVYLSAVQSVSYLWNYDEQIGQTNGLPEPQKSGSCY